MKNPHFGIICMASNGSVMTITHIEHYTVNTESTSTYLLNKQCNQTYIFNNREHIQCNLFYFHCFVEYFVIIIICSGSLRIFLCFLVSPSNILYFDGAMFVALISYTLNNTFCVFMYGNSLDMISASNVGNIKSCNKFVIVIHVSICIQR